MSITINRANGFCEHGDVIEISGSMQINGRYIVKDIKFNGDATILDILKDDAVSKIKRLVNQCKESPKKYRSTYNSKHGRVW